MSKKRANRKKHPIQWTALLKKYAFLAMPLVGLIFSGSRFGTWLLLLSFPVCFFCYCQIQWREDRKGTPQAKRIKLLARFWRYGYWMLFPPLAGIKAAFLPDVCADCLFGYFVLIYGVYTFMISLALCRHFICGMQDWNHQEMRPYASPPPHSQRDGLSIAFLSIALSLLLLMVHEH